MTPNDSERLEAISNALARMVVRQQQLDERLKRVEQGLATAGWLRQAYPESETPSQRPAPTPAPPAAVIDPPVQVEPAPVPIEPRAAAPLAPYPIIPEQAPAATLSEPRPGIESVFGLTWISRIGALTLVIGVGFFFKYAFENRWITETGRVLLGVAVAVGMLALGERFWRKQQSIYGQSLTAIGISFLYLSFWAAQGLYQIIQQSPAFVLMALTTSLAGALALRYNGAPIAVIGLLGGFLTPLLLETGRSPWFVLGYALLLAFGGLWLANRWNYLQIPSLIGSIALYATQWANPIPRQERFGFTLFALAFYGVFATGPVLGVALVAQLFAPVLLAGISEPDVVALLPALAVASAGLLIADRRGSPWLVIASFLGWWLAYASWWGTGGKLQPIAGPLAFQAAAFAVFLAWPLYRRLVKELPLRTAELLVIAANAILFFGTGYALLERDYRSYEGLFAVGVAVMQMGAAAVLWPGDRRGAMLSAGAAWTALVLAVPIQFTGYRVTMAWSLEAAALAWTGDRLRDSRISWTSLFVFVLALMRLIGEDSWMFGTVDYTPLLNIRFFTFMVSAAALFATAVWMHDRWNGAMAYIGGHFVLVWALCLEVSAAMARSASIQNMQSAQSTAISILLAVYAMVLVAGGVVQRSVLTRVIGIALIGFVVVKLYLYDVWLLKPFYRIVAFAVLGVALLGTANLYSRYRDKIGGWWRPE